MAVKRRKGKSDEKNEKRSRKNRMECLEKGDRKICRYGTGSGRRCGGNPDFSRFDCTGYYFSGATDSVGE